MPEAASDYRIIAILILTVSALIAAIMALTHLIGPKREGAIKHSTYEAGVDPLGDARRRFNIRFYLVGLLFILFDVELIFMYPWGVLFPRFRDPQFAGDAFIAELQNAGYGVGFFAAGIGVFFLLLTVGFIYEWRRGIFKWD